VGPRWPPPPGDRFTALLHVACVAQPPGEQLRQVYAEYLAVLSGGLPWVVGRVRRGPRFDARLRARTHTRTHTHTHTRTTSPPVGAGVPPPPLPSSSLVSSTRVFLTAESPPPGTSPTGSESRRSGTGVRSLGASEGCQPGASLRPISSPGPVASSLIFVSEQGGGGIPQADPPGIRSGAQGRSPPPGGVTKKGP